MMPFVYLRVLALATLTLLAVSCDQKENTPQPTNPTQEAAVAAKSHTVAVRYHLRASGRIEQLPAILPNIGVDYERVVAQGPTTYQLLASSAQHHDQHVDATRKEVQLAPIGTYASGVKPKITVTIWEEQALPAGSAASFQVISELVIDGKVAEVTTYSAVAGQNTPLFVTSQTEVAH